MGLTLEQAFADGMLVRPNHARPSLVHLVQAIARICGVRDLNLFEPARLLCDAIGPANHVIFILLDGLGMSTVRKLPTESFVAAHVRMELQATVPSTTACALTTVTTAAYPNQHGIAGWFTYLPEMGLTATVLPFKDRATHEPLAQRGIRPQDMVLLPSIVPKMTHRVLTITPSNITNTSYNYFSRGGTPGVGYDTIPHAIDRIIEEVQSATGPTYTHLYLPEIDTICHHLGVDHPDLVPKVMAIDREIARLADVLGTRARIILSADHGLIDVPREHQHFLYPGDPLLEMLQVPPTGDARLPIFHVHPDARSRFAQAFETRFAESMVLLSTDEAQRLELFGPGPFSPKARPRFGDFIAIPFRPATLAYHGSEKPLGELFLAVHAGLSPQEMWVPLCIV
jgi:hypothetical protein